MKLKALKDFAFGKLKCYDGQVFENDSSAINALLIYKGYCCEYTEKTPPKKTRKKVKDENKDG